MIGRSTSSVAHASVKLFVRASGLAICQAEDGCQNHVSPRFSSAVQTRDDHFRAHRDHEASPSLSPRGGDVIKGIMGANQDLCDGGCYMEALPQVRSSPRSLPATPRISGSKPPPCRNVSQFAAYRGLSLLEGTLDAGHGNVELSRAIPLSSLLQRGAPLEALATRRNNCRRAWRSR